MRVKTAAALVVATLLAMHFGCAPSSRSFVSRHAEGHRISKGRIVRVVGFRSSRWIHLTDGRATALDTDDCVVTMQLGREHADMQLPRDAILVYGREADYVIEPMR